MKLRIEPGRICYRLDFPELELLLSAGKIEEHVTLSNRVLSYKIIVQLKGSPPDFTTEDGFVLGLPRDVIEDHKKSLPSLKGINYDFPTANGEQITVSLEVNLKKKIKHSLE